MPSKHEHITKAEGNASFAKSLSLDNQTRIDRALVVLFYAAMHYVEAYLATTRQHLRSHAVRDRVLGTEPELKKVFKEYQDLKFCGYNARYEMYAFTPDDVTYQALKDFETIKGHLQKFL